jgi:hypothetical protein
MLKNDSRNFETNKSVKTYSSGVHKCSKCVLFRLENITVMNKFLGSGGVLIWKDVTVLSSSPCPALSWQKCGLNFTLRRKPIVGTYAVLLLFSFNLQLINIFRILV